MQMFSVVFYCKIIFKEVAEGMKVEKKEGGLYYLVAAALGPNYIYAFLTVSQSPNFFYFFY